MSTTVSNETRLIDRERLARAPDIERRPPIWAKLLGCRQRWWDGFQRGKVTFRAWYGEVTIGRVKWAMSLGSYGRPHLHVAVPGVQVFFRLPLALNRWFGGENDCERDQYGFGTFEGSIHFHWGHRTKIVDKPWGRRFEFAEYLSADGEWFSDKIKLGTWRVDDDNAGPPVWAEAYAYHYMTDQGEAQHVTATVEVKRYCLSWKFCGFRIKRWFKQSIDVSFDQEVGNQRGSWKGGTVGCDYDMKPGETPGMTLRRMQRERRFCR